MTPKQDILTQSLSHVNGYSVATDIVVFDTMLGTTSVRLMIQEFEETANVNYTLESKAVEASEWTLLGQGRVDQSACEHCGKPVMWDESIQDHRHVDTDDYVDCFLARG